MKPILIPVFEYFPLFVVKSIYKVTDNEAKKVSSELILPKHLMN